MGKPTGQSLQELLAFHSAMVAHQKEKGTLGTPISLDQWEKALTSCLSQRGTVLTRQSCNDKTWWMDRSNLIRRIEREGIILLEVAA